MSSERLVFTIGHSNHQIEAFITLLKKYQVNCIVDVRSKPYSKLFPQFNKDNLSELLKKQRINYLSFAKEFGARYEKKAFLDENNHVDFVKVTVGDDFKMGLKRLKDGLNGNFRICLMCAEADPFYCHRFVMIARPLQKEGFIVKHILKDGSLIDNIELEKALVKKYQNQLPKETLFEKVSRSEQLEQAYRLRNKDIAFAPEKEMVI